MLINEKHTKEKKNNRKNLKKWKFLKGVSNRIISEFLRVIRTYKEEFAPKSLRNNGEKSYFRI